MDISKAKKERFMQLNSLDEMRGVVMHHTEVVQNQRMRWHDKFIKDNKFQLGDWALLYDLRYQNNARKL